MNGSQSFPLSPKGIVGGTQADPIVAKAVDVVHIHISGTHNTGGMAFGHNPFQTKQRRTTKYIQDGVSIVLSRKDHAPVRFFMLPGGRWIEETVYRRFVNKEYKPGDPW